MANITVMQELVPVFAEAGAAAGLQLSATRPVFVPLLAAAVVQLCGRVRRCIGAAEGAGKSLGRSVGPTIGAKQWVDGQRRGEMAAGGGAAAADGGFIVRLAGHPGLGLLGLVGDASGDRCWTSNSLGRSAHSDWVSQGAPLVPSALARCRVGKVRAALRTFLQYTDRTVAQRPWSSACWGILEVARWRESTSLVTLALG